MAINVYWWQILAMKTLISTLILIFYSIANYAQPAKGGWLISGSASYTRINYNSGLSLGRITGHNISISPKVGFFITNRINVGLSVPFQTMRTRYSEHDFPSSNTSVHVGPFIRYYHPLPKNLFVLGEADFTVGQQWVNYYSTHPSTGALIRTKSSANNSRATVVVGLAYFLNNNIGIEWLTRYAVYQSTTPDRGFTSAIGLQFYLARD
jgi:hypothetical protein